MADIKMDEAIALGRIVAEGWNPDDLPLYPHEKAAVRERLTAIPAKGADHG